jgi:16S rRNA pseudouridine516 synthase
MSRRRLDRILQSQGFGTRRACRELILAGRVAAGSAAVVDPDTEFDTEGLRLVVDGGCCDYRERVYLALNKPAGIECSRQPAHHAGVLTLLPQPLRRRGVQPVGRLDVGTTGLLLLSDDGAFIHALGSPRRQVTKRYVASTAAPVTEALVARLLAGVLLHGETAPVAALACRALAPDRIVMLLAQGRYHQVRRMLAAAGNHCAALERDAIGGLELGALGLAPGEWTYLDEAQRRLLFAAPAGV